AGSSKLGRNVIEIHEDDWRQIEWITGPATEALESELAAIRRVYETERQGVGFKRVHTRPEEPQPLVGQAVQLDDLRAALDPRAIWLDGFSYMGVAGIVADSFAVRLLSSI